MVSLSLSERKFRAELMAKNYLESRYKGNRARVSSVGHVTQGSGPRGQLGRLRGDIQVIFLSQEVVYPQESTQHGDRGPSFSGVDEAEPSGAVVILTTVMVPAGTCQEHPRAPIPLPLPGP